MSTDAELSTNELAAELAAILEAVGAECREDADEVALEFLEPHLVGFHGSPYRTINGNLLHRVVEFTLEDGSAILLAETNEGNLAIFTSLPAKNQTLH
jgi:hypothetical protein